MLGYQQKVIRFKMKKIIHPILAGLLALCACQPLTKTVGVDLAVEKQNVIAVLNRFDSAMAARDAALLLSLLAPDGLYCGTDTSELLNKQALSGTLSETITDPAYVPNHSAGRREIRMAREGTTAIAVDQYIMYAFSRKMPVRLVTHLVKTGDTWLIDFFSWSFVPNNEDLKKLNQALL